MPVSSKAGRYAATFGLPAATAQLPQPLAPAFPTRSVILQPAREETTSGHHGTAGGIAKLGGRARASPVWSGPAGFSCTRP